jgi:hypothetical protein
LTPLLSKLKKIQVREPRERIENFRRAFKKTTGRGFCFLMEIVAMVKYGMPLAFFFGRSDVELGHSESFATSCPNWPSGAYPRKHTMIARLSVVFRVITIPIDWEISRGLPPIPTREPRDCPCGTEGYQGKGDEHKHDE